MSANSSASTSSSRWHRGRAPIAGTVSTLDEVTLAYIDCPPPSSTTSKGTILLIHGFPQTSYQFRKVITPIADAGYRVVVPDYRGAGESSKPRGGFEKKQMAADIHDLIHEYLKISGPVHVVGHDIGGMVAHAYAVNFPKDTTSVAWGECPLPGTSVYENSKYAPETFHFSFHWQPDLPEALVVGREKIYLKHFFSRLCYNHFAITDEDLDYYAAMYSQPGGLRCGFDCYRAFHQDAKDNQGILQKDGKCKIPMLALAGAESKWWAKAADQGREMYENFEQTSVEGSAHWVAEENPEGFVNGVLEFVKKNS